MFIDANIFIYHATASSSQCQQFLQRCATAELHGVTSVHILLEVWHRLMVIEAVRKELVPQVRAVQRLMRLPHLVRQLSEHTQQLTNIFSMGLRILSVDPAVVIESQNMQKRCGLLTNDSVSLRLMEQERISIIATADRDFARLKTITVWRPTDINMAA